MTVVVTVRLKDGVLDPQGKAIAGALERLGYAGVKDVRAGKVFRVEMEGADRAAALEAGKKMADQLLANTVIEEFDVEVGA